MVFVSGFIYLFNFKSDLNEKYDDSLNNYHAYDLNKDFDLLLSQSSLSEYSGVGKAQNVTNFAQAYFVSNDINVSNNENAAIIVPNEWQANQINWSITNILEYDNLWINERFDDPIDSSRWSHHTAISHRDYVESEWYQNPLGNNDSITLTLNELPSGSWDGVKSYLNYSCYLDREKIPYELWNLDFQYKFVDYATWLDDTVQSRFICTVMVNGIETEFYNPKIKDFTNNTWEREDFSFFPEFYGFNPPGTIEINFKIDIRDVINPAGNLTLFIDNFTLSLHTIAKPSQINLNITDYEHSISTPISDLDYGSGDVALFNTWHGDIGGKEYRFGFESNSTGTLIIFSECEVSATSQSYTRTHLTSLIGSEFTIENKTTYNWTMYVPISIPGAYTNNFYFNISKPINWNVTHVIDPYSNDRINDTIGVGHGNSTLTIPNHIISDGIWKIIAEAPNYVEEAIIFRKSNSEWQKNATFHILDTLKINGTVKTIPNIQNTNVSLNVFYPNGTLWYQEVDVSVNFDGTYQFSEITLTGRSAVSGEYSAQIIWHDLKTNMTQVGYSHLKFEVIHRTSLTAVNDYFKLYAGDPLLLTLKYIDSDFNVPISFAIITYNSNNGVTGIMTYKGSGTYILDLDTSSLELGDYYFSFNATEEYYEHKYVNDLIHLKILAREDLIPVYVFYILIASLVILLSVLSFLGLRYFVILPNKRAKKSDLLARTQRYKDIMNIRALVISQRESGIYLYIKSYYALEKYRKELLSGFISAITTISKEIVKKEDFQDDKSKINKSKSIENIIELDFKHFYFLIGDYKDLRVIFILSEKASERFKSQLQNLLLALNLNFSAELVNWTGNRGKFEELMPSTINRHFELYYKGFFQVNNPKYIAKVREEAELNTMENRILNTIYSMTKGKDNFYLNDIIEIIEEKNKDLVIDALESLLDKKIIISSK